MAALLVACGGSPSAGPNVVLISIDTLRADHVGLYGYPRDTTPKLDGFFGNATVFENTTTSAPCTIPAVRQYLTGILDDRPEHPALAEVLKEHGYATAAVVSQQQFYRGGLVPYARGFDHFDIQDRKEVDQHGWSARRASRVSDGALAWLDANAEREKFFLWLHYFDPHDPYEPPEAFRDFDAKNESALDGDRRSHVRAARGRLGQANVREQWGGELLGPEDVAHFVNLYDGELRYTDAEIGRVLDALAEKGLLERSIVVVTADHGEWLGEEGRWDHCATLSDVELRVPLLLRVNGRPLGEGGREAVPASTLDIAPTLLGLLDIPYAKGSYHGGDLRDAAPDRTAVALWGQSRSIRDREWKLLYHGDRPTFLYRIAADPAERWNRLTEEPQVVAELTARMRRFEALGARGGAESGETIERLRAIGYIE